MVCSLNDMPRTHGNSGLERVAGEQQNCDKRNDGKNDGVLLGIQQPGHRELVNVGKPVCGHGQREENDGLPQH